MPPKGFEPTLQQLLEEDAMLDDQIRALEVANAAGPGVAAAAGAPVAAGAMAPPAAAADPLDMPDSPPPHLILDVDMPMADQAEHVIIDVGSDSESMNGSDAAVHDDGIDPELEGEEWAARLFGVDHDVRHDEEEHEEEEEDEEEEEEDDAFGDGVEDAPSDALGWFRWLWRPTERDDGDAVRLVETLEGGKPLKRARAGGDPVAFGREMLLRTQKCTQKGMASISLENRSHGTRLVFDPSRHSCQSFVSGPLTLS